METKKRPSLLRRLVRGAVKLILLTALLCGGALLLYILSTAPSLDGVAPHGYRTTVLDDSGEVMLTLAGEESNRVYAGLDEIPENLRNAFLAIEDERFYQHHGIDLRGILRAAARNLAEGRIAQGASTITQQLIKNNLFSAGMEEKTLLDKVTRKVQEAYLALRLEAGTSKDWILENYLNTINLGGGTWGVQTAAQRYFGKDAAALTLPECAALAAIAGNPTRFNPLRNPEQNRDRQLLVLSRMRELGMITMEEYLDARDEDIYTGMAERAETVSAGVEIFSWFEDAAISQAAEDLRDILGWEDAWDAIYRGGLTIETTQNTALQALCEAEINRMDTDAQATAVLLDTATGAVKAIVGGRGEKVGSLSWNRAVSSPRQPGSTLKVVGEYAAALDTGKATLATVYDDAPVSYGDGTPIRNAGDAYGGRTTVRQAIVHSVNTTALRCFRDVGMDAVWQQLTRFGFAHLDEEDRVEALALGGTHGGVTNLELTAAYGALANGGLWTEPHFYTRILDREGAVVLEKIPARRQAVRSETAALLVSALEDVMTEGTGTEAAVSGAVLAGKSGTTSDGRDLWFVGFSPRLACGVWSGRDDFSPQDGASSAVKHVWRAIMGQAPGEWLEGTYPGMAALERRTICTKCGNLAVQGLCTETVQGNMARTELFAPGAAPVEECGCHVRVEFCKASGYQAGLYCRERESRVYLRQATPGTADEGAAAPTGGEVCTLHSSWWDWLFPEEWEYPGDLRPPNPEEGDISWWDWSEWF